MVPLSVAIITKDEENRLGACLESVSFADEIVVVDSGSTDSTIDVARSFGCRVFEENWKGYGAQKNSAIEKCLNDWVLVLDADERVTPEAREAIERAVSGGDGPADAYSFRRKNFFRGRWVRRCGEWPDRQVRLVRKSRGAYRASVHEHWVTDGPVARLEASLEHYSHDDYSGWIRKMNEYSTLAAIEMHGAGEKAGYLLALFHGAGMFLKTFVGKRGFLDGLDGLVICFVKACGSFFKYAKLRDLGMRDRGI